MGLDKDLRASQIMKEMITRMDVLSSVQRFSLHERVKEENVAEHSFRVSIIAMTIADLCMSFDPYLSIDMATLLRRCLLHDFEESVNGDISYVVKHGSKESEKFFEQLENDTVLKMFENIPQYRKHILECREDSIEGKIFALSDMFDIATIVSREKRLGHHDTNMINLLNNVMNYIESIVKEDDRFNFVKEIAYNLD